MLRVSRQDNEMQFIIHLNIKIKAYLNIRKKLLHLFNFVLGVHCTKGHVPLFSK